MANTLIKAIKTQHFSPSDTDIRRAAMLNDLLGEVRSLANTLSLIIGTGLAGASDAVVTEQAFGQAADAGAEVAYSRGDHTHGSPTFPTITGSMVDATVVTSAALSTAVQATRLEVEMIRVLVAQLVRLEMGNPIENGIEALLG